MSSLISNSRISDQSANFRFGFASLLEQISQISLLVKYRYRSGHLNCFFTLSFIVKDEQEALQLFPAKHVFETVNLLSEEEEEDESSMDMDDNFFHESTGTVQHLCVMFMVILYGMTI